MRAVLATIARAWRAAMGPMLFTSSQPLEVGIVSTLAGCTRDLFSEASAAEVYCNIIKPELRPPCSVRNGGKRFPFATGSRSRACLRSLILSWHTPIPRMSAATERGAVKITAAQNSSMFKVQSSRLFSLFLEL